VSYLPSGQFFSPGCNIGVTRYLSAIKRPATTITFMETTSPKWYWYPTPSPGSAESEAKQSNPANKMGIRHRGKGNYLFADGHVRTLSVRQTLAPTVMWDNISEWCPDCDCTQPPISGANRWWTQQRLDADLRELDEHHYP
jgi:prepilin-type processing-associated H-X9-DG protein